MPADQIHNLSWTPAGRKEAKEFTLPSGNKCRVRELELDDVMDLGLLDKFDSLSATVQEEHIERVQGKKAKRKASSEQDDKKAFRTMMSDPEKREDMKNIITMVTVACVVEPKLHDPWVNDPNSATPKNPMGRRLLEKNERDPQKAYVDYVNFVDKLEIFHEVFGGMERLQQFREEADESVGDLADESEPTL
jgi:hypothetical protein